MSFARFAACLLVLFAAGGRSDSLAGTRVNVSRSAQMAAVPEPIFVIYYWRARPGKAAAYSDYIRTVAEPIDEEARKAGIFESVHTYTPAIVTGAPGGDWTHMRVFQLKNMAAWEAFGAGLDEAAKRVYPDEARRKETMSPAADMRDLVRQEIWREFK
jgi:hypothetical protein